MKKGFTLVELVVVVVILGILASIAIPQYNKVIESSKATNSLAIAGLVGNANRMYLLDHPSTSEYIRGRLIGSLGPCDTGACTPTNNRACNLVWCNYLANEDWGSNNIAYEYYVCDPNGSGGGCCSGGYVSCTRRKSGASSPYNTWGYRFTNDGRCREFGTDTPACPTF
ncbi:MAG: prepilin-type N-terminal cleavage/methylation domain-containing protein [Elusimicrobia bacterium]|nr:prepilin-type N-terminal cleavage/methylation domain-containing protein [Elusimicrobiota bacterium]